VSLPWSSVGHEVRRPGVPQGTSVHRKALLPATSRARLQARGQRVLSTFWLLRALQTISSLVWTVSAPKPGHGRRSLGAD
jgi:hypothetical protein